MSRCVYCKKYIIWFINTYSVYTNQTKRFCQLSTRGT
ncbi:hypothetical protein [Herbinix hemicellulosilytica]